MKRLVAGGLALGLTSIGALALGGPAGAQEEFPEEVILEGTISPSVVAPGEEVTAESVDPCTVPEEGEPGDIYWVVFSNEDFDFYLEGSGPLEADGSWSVTFEAPAEPGGYEFYALCEPGDLAPAEEEMLESLAAEAPETLGDEPEVPEGEVPEGEEPGGEEPLPTYEYYGPLPFTVEGDDGGPEEPPAPSPTPTPEPPVAAPAQPVVGNPTFTG